jgi:cyclic pyranopterin phosphate synthase
MGSLRLSVTDRCNLRCEYCMPEREYVWLPKASILSYEEFDRLAGIFQSLGADRVRLTGGEPLLRHDLEVLVGMLAARPGLRDLAMTTNGLLLAPRARALREAGLRRITISLDTLRPERMLAHARSARHADVLAGIEAARAAGFEAVKLNAVVIRGFNADEVPDLIAYGRERGIEVRFIEYMDVGGATHWSSDAVVGQEEIVAAVAARHGPVEPLEARGSAPAERFRLDDGTVFGVIASTTRPFCRDCDRSRVTADGTWYLCLYGRDGVDLREALRSGTTDADLAKLIAEAWQARRDRGAEARRALPDRGTLVPLEGLRADPRQEMHTRGGCTRQGCHAHRLD